MPAPLRGESWDFAYRYAALPYELALEVETVLPRITAGSLAEVRLEPDELVLDLVAVYNVERAGVFEFALDLPEGYDVRRPSRRSISSGPRVPAWR